MTLGHAASHVVSMTIAIPSASALHTVTKQYNSILRRQIYIYNINIGIYESAGKNEAGEMN